MVTRGSGPGRPSSALGLGGPQRRKRASWGFCAALAGALMLASPALADSTIVPDPTLTPGASRTTDANEICSHGTRELRHMTRERSDFLLRQYGLPPGHHPDDELDHLIPLGIGGADLDSNIFPEPRAAIEPEWNAERKDKLEWKLRDLICSGQIDAASAQKAIAEDWTEAYRTYFGEPSIETAARPRLPPRGLAQLAIGARARRLNWARRFRNWLEEKAP